MKFVYSEAARAMRKALNLNSEKKCKIDLKLKKFNSNASVLDIVSSEPIFGTQPFFAFKSITGQYFHDNLDFQKPKFRWTYTFDEETLPLKAVEKIGIAANNSSGITTVSTLDLSDNKFNTLYLNI